MKIRLGITGGIGSGKSYVCRLLQQAGIPIYFCDDEAKRLNVENGHIRQGLIRLVGPEVYLSDGSLNKPVLIHYLFDQPEHASLINGLVHPVVLQDFLTWADRQNADIVGLEAALLFEAGYQQHLQASILVTAPLETRIQRIIERDHTTAEAARKRMQVQTPEEEQREQADFVIINDGVQPLPPQIEALLSFLRTKILEA